MRRALARYRHERPFVRLFVLARHLLAPLRRVAADVPRQGRILDLGCGHGLLVNLLAVGSPERQILGVEPSEEKLKIARSSSRGLPNVRYQHGRIDEVTEETPADKAGLKSGDVILAVDDQKLAARTDFLALLAKKKPNDEITMVVRRDP